MFYSHTVDPTDPTDASIKHSDHSDTTNPTPRIRQDHATWYYNKELDDT